MSGKEGVHLDQKEWSDYAKGEKKPSDELDLIPTEEALTKMAERIEALPFGAPAYIWIERHWSVLLRGAVSLGRSNYDAFHECLKALKQKSEELTESKDLSLYWIGRAEYAERKARREAFEEAAQLHESVNPADDLERLHGDPGAGAMGAVIEYRDKIRALMEKG